MIGEQGYHLSPDSALRIEVPPGQYWLHPWYKPLKKAKPPELVSLNAKDGESYYYRFALGQRTFVLQSVSAENAAELISDAEVYVNLPIEEAKPEQLRRLQIQPPAK
jgi:hypothetical protein